MKEKLQLNDSPEKIRTEDKVLSFSRCIEAEYKIFVVLLFLDRLNI